MPGARPKAEMAVLDAALAELVESLRPTPEEKVRCLLAAASLPLLSAPLVSFVWLRVAALLSNQERVMHGSGCVTWMTKPGGGGSFGAHACAGRRR